MAEKTVNVRLRQITGTSSTLANKVPLLGELVYETNTGYLKIGNGSSKVSALNDIGYGKYLAINGTATNSTKLNGQPASYYLNYANITGKPADYNIVYYGSHNGSAGSKHINQMFGFSEETASFAKAAICRIGQYDDFNMGLSAYGTAFGWHGGDTGGYIACGYQDKVITVGGIQGSNGIRYKVNLIHSDNIANQSVYNSARLGNIVAANYVNTSDTLVLVGTI